MSILALIAVTVVLPLAPGKARLSPSAESVLLQDDFEAGIGQWTPFLNYWRLDPSQWYWGATDGYGGSGGLTQDAYAEPSKEAKDALMMYLGAGAQDWTDYRARTRIILRTDSTPHGLWLRGHYQDVGSSDPAGWTTGYYVVIGGEPGVNTHFVSLQQLQTVTDCWDTSCSNPGSLYDFNNPHTLVIQTKPGALERDRWYTLEAVVYQDRTLVWLDGELYIDYVDAKEPFLSGTVGFKTYQASTVSYDDLIVTSAPFQPTASLAVTPITGTTSTVFDFDASGSFDIEDPPAALEFRWDWEGDGIFDTPYTTTLTATHSYAAQGTKTVHLEVRDTDLLTDTATIQILVYNPWGQRVYLPVVNRGYAGE